MAFYPFDEMSLRLGFNNPRLVRTPSFENAYVDMCRFMGDLTKGDLGFMDSSILSDITDVSEPEIEIFDDLDNIDLETDSILIDSFTGEEIYTESDSVLMDRSLDRVIEEGLPSESTEDDIFLESDSLLWDKSLDYEGLEDGTTEQDIFLESDDILLDRSFDRMVSNEGHQGGTTEEDIFFESDDVLLDRSFDRMISNEGHQGVSNEDMAKIIMNMEDDDIPIAWETDDIIYGPHTDISFSEKEVGPLAPVRRFSGHHGRRASNSETCLLDTSLDTFIAGLQKPTLIPRRS